MPLPTSTSLTPLEVLLDAAFNLRVQRGQQDVTVPIGSTTAFVTITFSPAFASTPFIQATPHLVTGQAVVANESATDFRLYAARQPGAATTAALVLPISWVAVL